MKNKNMMIMGVVMMACQIVVIAIFGLLFAYDYGATFYIAEDTAVSIVAGTFLVLINILAISFITIGASDGE